MGRRNLDAYTEADWRLAAGAVGQILLNGWRVIAECEKCQVRVWADLEALAWRRGPGVNLWGAKGPCRVVGCPGRSGFWLAAPGAVSLIAMTAKR